MAYPQQSSTVVVTQPATQAVTVAVRPWGSGICACFDDCGICVPATFVPACYQCAIMSDFNEDCCVAWPCFLGPNMALLALRYRFRDQQKIEGSLMNDCMVSACCYQCALCQLKREHQKVRYQVPIPINPVVIVQSGVPQMASSPMIGGDPTSTGYNQY